MHVSPLPAPDYDGPLQASDHWDVAAAVASEPGSGTAKMDDQFVFLGPGLALTEAAGNGYVFGVFDGRGDRPGGGRAANAAADCFRGMFPRPDSLHSRLDQLAATLREANQAVLGIRTSHEPYAHATTTATVCWLGLDHQTARPHVSVVSVGGSTMWIFGHDDLGAFRQKWRTPVPASAQGATTPLGTRPDDLTFFAGAPAVCAGDFLVLATDGLLKTHGTPLNVATLLEAAPDPATFVRTWVATARARGSTDDKTAICVEIG